jgi:hypothetical protein
MEKLIAAYLANPNDANAEKVRAHGTRKPMSVCLLSPVEHSAYRDALGQLTAMAA